MAEYIFPTDNKSNLRREDFQKTVGGKQTDLFILRNSKGAELCVTNFGAIVPAIMMPDRDGHFASVVLGHDTIDGVINSPEPFLGSTIGRYGNRIAKGTFTLDGVRHELNINNGPNSLHGGPAGFHRAVWEAEPKSAQSIVFRHTSPDNDEFFPGRLEVEMTYTLTDDNEFVIEYLARTDKTTVVNLTNHAFFNLAGIGNPTKSVEDNVVTINADFFIPIDETSIPTGEILKVEGTPMDFRAPHTVGSRINDAFRQLEIGRGYDHCYVLNKTEAGELTFAAKCVEPTTGRTLEVYTTEPGVQLYTGNWLGGFSGAHGATFPERSAICFEAQHFPDTPNRHYFPSCRLEPGMTYRQTTIYKFGVE